MDEFLKICFSPPVLPATSLLLMCTLYWVLVIIGAFDLDFLDFDLDADFEVQPDSNFQSAVSAGFLVGRFLNLNDVPLMAWCGIFSLCMWAISMFMMMCRPEYGATFWSGASMAGLSAAGALVLTKLITQPLKGKFDGKQITRNEDLIGKEGRLTTRATPESGQAEVPDDAAPLRLNVRTRQGALPKGETVRIVEYDSDRHVYFVDQPKPDESS